MKVIIAVLFEYDDAETWKKEGMCALFTRRKKKKKDKHGQKCHKQGKHCSLFVLSFDGVLGKEAQVVLATLSGLMAAKTEEPILHVKGWANGGI